MLKAQAIESPRTSIWVTPMSTEIFIFREFTNRSSLLAPCHAGSIPKGYGPGPHEAALTEGGRHRGMRPPM